jgi:hypothetical protein
MMFFRQEGLIQGIKRYLQRERRRVPRYAVTCNVNFFVLDGITRKPRTAKVPGLLTAVSRRGACLQIQSLQIANYHLLLDNHPAKGNLLLVEVQPPPGEKTRIIKTRVLSYDKSREKREFQFDVRLEFVDMDAAELDYIESLIKSMASAATEPLARPASEE